MSTEQNDKSSIIDPRESGIEGMDGINVQPKDDRDFFQRAAQAPLVEGRAALNQIQFGEMLKGPKEYLDNPEFGKSKYDKRIDSFSDAQNLGNARATHQNGFEKLGNAGLKMGVLAATTFADTWVGTVAGAVNVIAGIGDIAKSDSPLREIGNKFINNPFSVAMQDINKWSEEVLPNYYSDKENENEWYQNIFTANFVGDKLLKNVGFMVGAGLSAKGVASMASKAMNLKKVRDVYKGVVVNAAGKQLKTGAAIAKAYKAGDAFMDGAKLTDDLGKAAKQLKTAELKLKLIGASASGMGEARIEAISGSQDWFDGSKQILDDKKTEAIDNIENELFQEHPEWFEGELTPNGTHFKITHPDGMAEWDKRKAKVDDKYNRTLEELAHGQARMANKAFALNATVLTAGNWYQFGRFIAGGYNTGRTAKSMVKGSIKEGYKPSKLAVAKVKARALSNIPMEAQEEMTQAWIQEGTGLQEGAKMNSFYGDKINPDAEEEHVNWLNASMGGFENSYGDAEQWEQGFIGALTGGMGMPSFSVGKRDNGKKKLSMSFKGELWDGMRDAKEMKGESVKIADALNKIIAGDEFKNLYAGGVRREKLQNDMDTYLASGDAFNYKNAQHSQLISDALMFNKAGKLQDFYEMIDEGSNITVEDVPTILENTIDKNTGKSLYEDKAPEEVVAHIKEQAEEVREKVDKYVKISDDLTTLYGEDLSNDAQEELTWMLSSVDDMEGRFSSLYESTKKTINEIVKDRDERYYGKNNERKVGALESISPGDLLNKMDNEEVTDLLNAEADRVRQDKDKSLKHQQLFKDFGDMMKLFDLRTKFLDKYEAVAKDPQLFTNEFQETLKKTQEAYAEKALKNAETLLETATTQEEFRTVLNGMSPALVPDVLEKIKASGNKQLMNLQDNFEKINNIAVLVDEVVESRPDSPELAGAMSAFMDARDNSNTEKEFFDLVEVHKMALPEPVAVLIDEILADYKETSKSRDVDGQDKNDTPKAPSVQSGGFTLEDVASDDIDAADAERLEAMGEVPPPAKNDVAKPATVKLENVPKEEVPTAGLKEEQSGGKEGVVEKESNEQPEYSDAGGVEEAAPFFPAVQKSKEVAPVSGPKAERPPLPSYLKQTAEDSESDALVKQINAMSEEEIQGLADGTKRFPREYPAEGVDAATKKAIDAENKVIQDIAKDALVRIQNPLIVDDSIGTNDDPDIQEQRLELSDGFRGWTQTRYDIGALKNRQQRKKVERDGSTVPLVGLLNSLGTYDFVDKGHLSKVLKHNPNTSIHYITSSDNSAYNQILLGIEMTQELKDLGIPGNDAIVGNDGKQYQIVGTLGYDGSGAKGTTEQQARANKLGAARTQLLKELHGERQGSKTASQYFVSQNQETNKVKHLYSGRMVTSTSSQSNKLRPVTKEFFSKNEVTPRFGFYFGDTDFRTPGIDTNLHQVVPLNQNAVQRNKQAGNNLDLRAGSMWMMVQEADGKYYAKAVRVRNFSEDDYNMTEHADKPIIAALREQIAILVNPENTTLERSRAKFAITDILYFSPETPIILFNGNDVSLKGFENNIGDGMNLADKETFFLETLQELGLRFQVQPSKILDAQYLDDVLSSEILYTDLIQPNNINASFDIFLPGAVPTDVSERDATGHTGHKGMNTNIPLRQVRMGDTEYQMFEDGIVKLGEEEVTGDLADEIRLLDKIGLDLSTPEQGSTNFYMGAYSDGSGQFAINNGSIVRDKDKIAKKMDALKKKVKADAKKKKLADTSEEEVATITTPGLDKKEDGLPDYVDGETTEADPMFPQSNVNEDTDGLPTYVDGETTEAASMFPTVDKTPTQEQKKETPLVRNVLRSAEELEIAANTVDFDTLTRDRRDAVRKLGFNHITFKEHVNNPANKLPNSDTINTKEAFDAVLKTIEECR